MTKDEIIKLAKEAGLVEWLPNSTFSDGIWWIDAHEPGSELLEFVSLVAQQEREQCARLADEIDPVWESISAAIRARETQ